MDHNFRHSCSRSAGQEEMWCVRVRMRARAGSCSSRIERETGDSQSDAASANRCRCANDAGRCFVEKQFTRGVTCSADPLSSTGADSSRANEFLLANSMPACLANEEVCEDIRISERMRERHSCVHERCQTRTRSNHHHHRGSIARSSQPMAGGTRVQQENESCTSVMGNSSNDA